MATKKTPPKKKAAPAASKTSRSATFNIFTGGRFRPAVSGPLDPAADFNTQSGTVRFDYVPTSTTDTLKPNGSPRKMNVSVTKTREGGRTITTLHLVE
jgi:hypothetical protein